MLYFLFTIIVLGVVFFGTYKFFNSNDSTKLFENKFDFNFKSTVNQFLNGNFSLLSSFWLVGFLGTIIIGSLIFFLLMWIFGRFETSIIRLILLPWYVVISIGIWKSSSNYKGLKVWSILSKVMVVIWNVNNVLGIILGTLKY